MNKISLTVREVILSKYAELICVQYQRKKTLKRKNKEVFSFLLDVSLVQIKVTVTSLNIRNAN